MLLKSTPEIIGALSGDVPLLDAENAFVERITAREAQVLTGYGYINGHVYKGRLTHVRLRPGVSARVAMQRLSPLQVAASGHITKCRQSTGAKRWVPHLERADGGAIGRTIRLIFPLTFREQSVC